MSGVQNVRDRAKKSAINTSTKFLDGQKHRIYQTAKGAMFTHTPGGYKNYNPVAKYLNKPGSNIIKRLY